MEIGKFARSRVLKMFVPVRAITYAALFIGLLFIYLPGRLLVWSGAVQPAVVGTPQIAGMIVGGVGAAIALWCISIVHFGTGHAEDNSARPFSICRYRWRFTSPRFFSPRTRL